jgi:hypothetical protein
MVSEIVRSRVVDFSEMSSEWATGAGERIYRLGRPMIRKEER